jgi:hypothetical protein
VPGLLEMRTLPGALTASGTEATLRATATGKGPARIDAVAMQPLVEWLVLAGNGGGSALLRSFAATPRTATVTVDGDGPATVTVYDAAGRLVTRSSTSGATIAATTVPGGFTLVER